jgi:hypothetical protein
MSQPETHGTNELPAKDDHDAFRKCLHEDARDAEETPSEDDIPAAPEVRDESCRERSQKNPPIRGRVEDLLGLSRDLAPIGRVVAEFVEEGWNREDVADEGDFVAKVDGQDEDQQT